MKTNITMKTIKSFIILSIAVAFAACGQQEKTEQNTEAVQLPPVKVSIVTARAVEQTYEFTATVEPAVRNNINPAAPGRIRNIYVEVGDAVLKGQKLAEMDVANLVNSETQIENFKRVYNRIAELFAVGGASQQELDNAKLQLTLAETNYKNLKENTQLLSPISGVITSRNYDNGDVYNGQQPILTVMQINPVQLKINISETFFSRVKTGMPVDVRLDVYEGELFTGKVSLVYPTIDERTRTFPVEIKLQNPGNKIRPGMFARVNINFGILNRVVVPDQAVVKQSGSGARFVYVYEDGAVTYQQIELGRRMDKEYELISGVESGASVVVSGQSRLTDGTKVVLVD